MTVADVWGRVQGQDALPLSHSGDEWLFPTPPGMSGQLLAEFWAEDEAGNVGYRAAAITLDKGAIKCWRWLDSGADCTMRGSIRPTLTPMESRPVSSMDAVTAVMTDMTVRIACTMRPHVCPAIGGI